jgi:hypothetical protein
MALKISVKEQRMMVKMAENIPRGFLKGRGTFGNDRLKPMYVAAIPIYETKDETRVVKRRVSAPESMTDTSAAIINAHAALSRIALTGVC